MLIIAPRPMISVNSLVVLMLEKSEITSVAISSMMALVNIDFPVSLIVWRAASSFFENIWRFSLYLEVNKIV